MTAMTQYPRRVTEEGGAVFNTKIFTGFQLLWLGKNHVAQIGKTREVADHLEGLGLRWQTGYGRYTIQRI
jgi:hypothetical protein